MLRVHFEPEHLSPNFFLQDINKALEKNTFLTGQFLTVADIAAYYVLYSIIVSKFHLFHFRLSNIIYFLLCITNITFILQERLSVLERESILHVCRWSKHIQAQPRVCASKPPLPLNTLTLSLLAPAVH